MIQYKNGEFFSFLCIINEVIKRNNSYDIDHTADIEFGSSGSSLILLNYKVVGIQKGFAPGEAYNFNKEKLLKFPINEYKKRHAINNIIK